MKKNYEGHQPTDKLDTSNPPKGHPENPYDLTQNGLKFDALKKEHESLEKRNGELVEALGDMVTIFENGKFIDCEPSKGNFNLRINKAIKALKNNNND